MNCPACAAPIEDTAVLSAAGRISASRQTVHRGWPKGTPRPAQRRWQHYPASFGLRESYHHPAGRVERHLEPSAEAGGLRHPHPVWWGWVTTREGPVRLGEDTARSYRTSGAARTAVLRAFAKANRGVLSAASTEEAIT